MTARVKALTTRLYGTQTHLRALGSQVNGNRAGLRTPRPALLRPHPHPLLPGCYLITLRRLLFRRGCRLNRPASRRHGRGRRLYKRGRRAHRLDRHALTRAHLVPREATLATMARSNVRFARSQLHAEQRSHCIDVCCIATACQRPSRRTNTRVYRIRPENGMPRNVPSLSAIPWRTATWP